MHATAVTSHILRVVLLCALLLTSTHAKKKVTNILKNLAKELVIVTVELIDGTSWKEVTLEKKCTSESFICGMTVSPNGDGTPDEFEAPLDQVKAILLPESLDLSFAGDSCTESEFFQQIIVRGNSQILLFSPSDHEGKSNLVYLGRLKSCAVSRANSGFLVLENVKETWNDPIGSNVRDRFISKILLPLDNIIYAVSNSAARRLQGFLKDNESTKSKGNNSCEGWFPKDYCEFVGSMVNVTLLAAARGYSSEDLELRGIMEYSHEIEDDIVLSGTQQFVDDEFAAFLGDTLIRGHYVQNVVVLLLGLAGRK
mmetsp:Transcript_21341/g.38739  ORF Transcript_21341/g.38739 Transcript_21341/m.38739 type:complete len:312 (-) Transcript_21341:143-1078(-)|eukprot:CAMPEP_0202498748 /NCGR_PEP_ID=MMETSP1361-20130828/27392_1 /ASSEMBLY_ACC=CAM_ASM_000849 /TAXON_ID=210615 /ORGANISM="Staurosira complex sp., Strain CCMP2646" /LENGTH=311 /DNA_ID=CAMNT_0049130755 /DNA_START=662 /DNA_END=1597 /DNA_ORIENTATION=-